MAKTTDTDLEHGDPPKAGASVNTSEVQAWFVREVLPLEAALMQFLRRIRHSKADAGRSLSGRLCSGLRNGADRNTAIGKVIRVYRRTQYRD